VVRVRVETTGTCTACPHGVHVSPIQRRSARPRGAMPQGARPHVVRPRGSHGGRAQRGLVHGQYDFGPHGGGFRFQSHSSSRPCFPPHDARFPQMGHGMFGVFPNTFPWQMSQH
jgi:hypothetical protein